MTVRLPVVETLADASRKGRGEFEFIGLPSKGDRFAIGNMMGDLDIMEVLYVEHHVVTVPPRPELGGRLAPEATVYAQCLYEYGGPEDEP